MLCAAPFPTLCFLVFALHPGAWGFYTLFYYLSTRILQSSTWNNKGYAFRKQQKYNLALECYREAVRIQPGYAKAWYNMGYVLDKLGNYEASLDAFDHAIELAPDNEKYVASRKAVESTWREFQSVFDNSSVTSASSAATNTSSVSASLDLSPSSVSGPIPGSVPHASNNNTSSTSTSSAIGIANTNTAGSSSSRSGSIAVLSTNPSHIVAENNAAALHNLNNGGPNISPSSLYSINSSSASSSSSAYRRRSGSAPNGEIPAHLLHGVDHLNGDILTGAPLTTADPAFNHPINTHGLDGSGVIPIHTNHHSNAIADFNPFLDFESSSLNLAIVSDLTSSAPPTISRPTTPPSAPGGASVTGSTSPGLSGTPLPPISSSMPETSSPMSLNVLNSGNLSLGTPSVLMQSIPLNSANSDPSMFLRSSQPGIVGSGQGIPNDSMTIALPSTGRLSMEETTHYAYIPSHISHLRSSSHNASNSSPALQLSHHPDRHHSVPASGGSGSRDHSARSPHTHRSANGSADESSSSSTGSNGDNPHNYPAPHISHARSMSAAASPRGPRSGHPQQLAPGNIPNITSALQNTGVEDHKLALDLEDRLGAPLSSVDASTLLNNLQSSVMPNPQVTGNSGSPEASDSEQHDLVHIGLPRARTYLEAIYSHLQNVKTVKDAEKLEKALEEMLAAVRVKRAFLTSKASAENEDKCACCWERPPEMVCIPCGHLCICEECKYKLRQKKCPICSQPVKNIYKVFK